MYANILAATDGSELATRGVRHAIDLAKLTGARLVLVTVSEPFPFLGAGSEAGWGVTGEDILRFRQVNEESARQVLAEAKRLADEAGVPATTFHVSDSNPAFGIVDTAKAQGCDLIVVASHGRRGLQRLILGSETNEVLVTSSVPVLVVR
ncbi:universal stress protein [Antarcticirhabdus aurantiaca]|uniref:Universal stress protein n=1 Tax=Antarcticirhabdus aurantiaca TaxID=2606717 RepID=A0ACD4NVT8_9HYPH|nr:universal stress protein [Antarcticirhabdus aurantiaca]WAJ31096.1 universal stress protein [Jeongeuplla avenae]